MYFDPIIFNNHTYKIILVLAYSIFGTYLAAEYLKKKFFKRGFVVTDKYKKEQPTIANLGGTAALVGVIIAIFLSQLLVKELSTANLLIYYFIVITHALFGLIDDLILTSNRLKIIAPYFMVIPVIILASQTSINLFGHVIELGMLFPYLLAPVFVLVVTNLINMHSGYNGLASGVSWLLMLALGIRSVIMGQFDTMFYLAPIFGALTVLCFYDSNPAKMIWGNIGSMMMGAAIGTYMIVSHAEIFGLIILIPHIVDFLLYLSSITIAGKKFNDIKFGKLRKDGTLEAPTPLKLKFLFPYYFRLTEKQTTWILYGVTALFCVIALMVGV